MTERPVALPSDHQGSFMTDLQKQIERLEQQGNDAELFSLLAYDPDVRERLRMAAGRFRLLAVELRYKPIAPKGPGSVSECAMLYS
jgi:hypothetical protein